MSPFDLILDLPELLQPTFTRVATFADTHVTFGETQVGGNGTQAATPGTDIAFDRVQSTTIHNEDGSAAHLAADVTGFIADSFPAVARERLAKRIGLAFTGPAKDALKGVLTRMESRDEELGWERAVWEYRLLCAYPNADLPGHFYTLVTTIRYTHEVKTEPGFLGLGRGSVKHSYSADVVAMRLAVEQGFGEAL
ncbi:hypothetical protein LXA43DRAFT_1004889 [Ganoderma leucocontextum]|nr:hypothetical protein LXA43DRAFT_1004889 [Ganoderma leucocontextum]